MKAISVVVIPTKDDLIGEDALSITIDISPELKVNVHLSKLKQEGVVPLTKAVPVARLEEADGLICQQAISDDLPPRLGKPIHNPSCNCGFLEELSDELRESEEFASFAIKSLNYIYMRDEITKTIKEIESYTKPVESPGSSVFFEDLWLSLFNGEQKNVANLRKLIKRTKKALNNIDMASLESDVKVEAAEREMNAIIQKHGAEVMPILEKMKMSDAELKAYQQKLKIKTPSSDVPILNLDACSLL